MIKRLLLHCEEGGTTTEAIRIHYTSEAISLKPHIDF